MSRFLMRMKTVDRQVDRQFAEQQPVFLLIDSERRPVTGIFESPDASVKISGGGEIEDCAPAFSLYTADIKGLKKRHQILMGTESWWVTHVGSDEAGRTRVRLANGEPGKPAPVIDSWSK
ncbi:hypothetical protein ASE93_12340 [Serratia sp. Leaf50]|nr:hypothetical protein ASE93_12340 [Serratia sp. Leaf50]